MISIGVKAVPSHSAERIEATTGSNVPIKVAFIGPIRLIPWIKAENEITVPTMTMKEMASQPYVSKSGVSVQICAASVKIVPPIIMPSELTGGAPQRQAIPCERMGYTSAPMAATNPQKSPDGDKIIEEGFPSVATRYTPKTANMTDMFSRKDGFL